MGFLRGQKSLAELQEEDEQLSTEVSIAKKRAMIRELKQKYGSGYVRAFSDNGKRSGLNWSRAWAWLKTH